MDVGLHGTGGKKPNHTQMGLEPKARGCICSIEVHGTSFCESVWLAQMHRSMHGCPEPGSVLQMDALEHFFHLIMALSN